MTHCTMFLERNNVELSRQAPTLSGRYSFRRLSFAFFDAERSWLYLTYREVRPERDETWLQIVTSSSWSVIDAHWHASFVEVHV